MACAANMRNRSVMYFRRKNMGSDTHPITNKQKKSMIITVEMSHYPLVEIYEGPIISLIQKLKTVDGIDVYTNAMSTYLQGEYGIVMEHLTKTLKLVFEEGVPSSTVIKIIPRKLPVERGWMEF